MIASTITTTVTMITITTMVITGMITDITIAEDGNVRRE